MAYNPNNPNGQATSANSAPVVIASDQSAVPVSDNGGSLTVDGSVTVSGTVTANAGTGTMNVSVQNASIPITDNGGSLTVDGSVSVSNFPATQPVSGTVTVTQATAGNLNANVTVQNASIPVTDNGGSLTVDGTVAATQSGTWNINNISGTVSLPTGAATSANQSTVITALQLLDDVVATDGSAALTKLYQVGGTDGTNAQIISTNTSGHVNIADGGNSITVDGTVAATQSGTWNITNITGTVSLPTGAATAAKQPALGTAGTASADVITVQGIASMVALKVDGSAVTQPVSGTVTANAGTGTMNVSVQNASIPVTDNGGSLTVDGSVSVSNFPATQAVSATNLDIRDLTATDVVTVTGGAGQTTDVKITLDSEQVAISNFPATQTVSGTVAATQSGTWSTRTQDGAGNAVTSRATGSSRPFDVAIVDGSGNQVTSFGGGTQYADGAAVANPTGTVAMGSDGVNVFPILTDDTGIVLVNVTNTIPVNDNGGSLTVDGSVSVSNFPATQTVSGTVTIQDGGNTITVDGSVTADTELPTAAALSDAAANPTTPTVGAANLGFNGTTWDRLKSEGTNADGEAVGTAGSLSVCAHGEVYNGTTWDRMRAASALDGTGATSHTGILGVLQVGKRFDPANLGTAVSSTSVVDVNGSNSITLAIETTTTGTFVIEGTADGINWGTPEVFDAAADIWVSGTSLTPTLGKVYQVLCGGFRSIRIRTTATLGATVAHAFNATMSQAFLGGIDTGAAPHNFGYITFHKDGEYSTTQTGAALWTPTSGKKFVVTDFTISTGGTTSGIVTLWQGASGDTAYTTGTDPALFRGEFAPSATAKPGIAKVLTVPFVSTTADHVLKVTTSAAMTIYVQVNGYEI